MALDISKAESICRASWSPREGLEIDPLSTSFARDAIPISAAVDLLTDGMSDDPACRLAYRSQAARALLDAAGRGKVHLRGTCQGVGGCDRVQTKIPVSYFDVPRAIGDPRRRSGDEDCLADDSNVVGADLDRLDAADWHLVRNGIHPDPGMGCVWFNVHVDRSSLAVWLNLTRNGADVGYLPQDPVQAGTACQPEKAATSIAPLTEGSAEQDGSNNSRGRSNIARRRLTFAVDTRCERIVFADGPELKGVGYRLVANLAERRNLDPDGGKPRTDHLFVLAQVLADDLKIDEPTLRKQLLRTRQSLKQQFGTLLSVELDGQEVIQSSPGKGYRLNPSLIRAGSAEIANVTGSDKRCHARRGD